MKLLQCGYGHIGEILFKNEFSPIARAVKGELYTYDPNVASCPNKVNDLNKSIHDGSFKFFFTDIKTAIVAKYAENCYLATKVTFFCEIAEVCKTVGIEYEDVRNILIEDSRINSSHTFVYEDHPYYDSHCLNKDIPAFISQFNSPLIKAVDEINTNRKRQITLDNK